MKLAPASGGRRLRLSVPLVALVVVCAVSLGATSAYAAWSATGNGAAAGAAKIMPSGNKPTGNAGTGSVTVAWTAATLSGGVPVGGYLVRRYDATTNTLQPVGGTCAGVVTSTTCTDQPVPTGSWVYTDIPVLDNWHGPESPRSTAVTL